jgi:hypothetical protein
MNHVLNNRDVEPWYRQAWPWFLISLPASAVIGGIITIILAVQSPNALVVDEYYKAGLAINQEKQRQTVARSLALKGLLRSQNRELSLALASSSPVTDKSLTLRLIHSTRAELDHKVVLQQTATGKYSALSPDLLAGIWYLRLQPADHAWEIRERVVVDGDFQAHLTAEE